MTTESIDANGNKMWYRNGKRHRDNDMPAIEYANGTKAWFRGSKLHRDGELPAIEYADGTNSWFRNGIPYEPRMEIYRLSLAIPDPNIIDIPEFLIDDNNSVDQEENNQSQIQDQNNNQIENQVEAKITTNQCVICLNNNITHIYPVCGHACICSTCINNINNSNNSRCPICRKQQAKPIRFYLP